jgi:hypothetical protein
MIPIEWVVVLLWLVFGLIGLSRRFPVELGATIGFTAMLLALEIGRGRIAAMASGLLGALGLSYDPSLTEWWILSTVIVAWVVFMYSGQTLSFQGVWPPGKFVGSAIDVLTGLFNGWIVVGTWWFITDALDYPIQQLGFYVPPLSDTAARLVQYTPPALIPAPYSVVVVGGFLVFLIALKVFR